MLVFRAISECESEFKGKEIEELVGIEYREDCKKYINTHLTKGNFSKNQYWNSFSKSFNIAYNYSEPSVYRGVRSNIQCQRNLKIRKRNIIACEFNTSQMLDITNKDSRLVKENCGASARNYGLSNKEVLKLGRVKDFIKFTLFQGDLIYILNNKVKYEEEDCLYDIMRNISNVENELQLNTIEKIIFELIYNNNKNLYEIIAPVYYTNNVDVKYIYLLIFDILKSILIKGLRIVDANINIDKQFEQTLVETLIHEMYMSELNFICIKYREYNYGNKICNCKALLELYKNDLKCLGELELIDIDLAYLHNKKDLLKQRTNYYTTKEYPLYLYLPKDEKIILKEYFVFNIKRDMLFQIVRYETERRSKYGGLEPSEYDFMENRRYGYIPNRTNKGYLDYECNICKFTCEVYISDSYIEIEEGVFDLEINGEHNNDLVNLYYSDLLKRVFGGKNLKKSQVDTYFKYRKFIKEIK